MQKISEAIAEAADAAKDAWFRATDKFVRCTKRYKGIQCFLSKGHKGKHDFGSVT